VKIYLLYNDQRIAKKKTHVKKRTLNPVFNESFVFDLPQLDEEGLKNISLEFLLLDWDRVTKNEVRIPVTRVTQSINQSINQSITMQIDQAFLFAQIRQIVSILLCWPSCGLASQGSKIAISC
jgi:Ca2+-dependent lipid-binding protein